MLTLLVSCLSLSGELTLGLVVPSFPWTFGPYQAQGLQLAVELSSRHGWKVYWLPVVESLPEGLYRTSDEAATTARMRRPPPGWDDEHGTHIAGYIGRSWGIYPRVKQVGELNKAAREHGLHAYVMLMDVNMLLRDEDFAIPALSWFPYHFDSLNHVDGYTLAAFSGVASLAPSSAAILERGLGGKLPVRWIPHIVEPELLGVGGPPHPLTLPAGTFLILMQGGNYERSDRKGWSAAIEAFREFYQARPDAHLLLHAISSRAILRDGHGREPPHAVEEEGVPLRLLLQASGLPREAYTLEERVLPANRTAALKRAADVCLHPSKTEGFGMNLLECQLVGTPVVSTAFGSMGDFTRLGIAVPHQQRTFLLRGMVAQPHVPGVVAALHAVYNATRGGVPFGDPAETAAYIRRTFSARVVGDAFHDWLVSLVESPPPSSPRIHRSLYHLVSGSHTGPEDSHSPWVLSSPPGVHYDHRQLQGLLSALNWTEFDAALVPLVRADGSAVPPVSEDGSEVHPDQPVLVRTALFVNAQLNSFRRLGVVQMILSMASARGRVKRFPDGLARFAHLGGGEEQEHHEHDEL